jgi:hypothetical protein
MLKIRLEFYTQKESKEREKIPGFQIGELEKSAQFLLKFPPCVKRETQVQIMIFHNSFQEKNK